MRSIEEAPAFPVLPVRLNPDHLRPDPYEVDRVQINVRDGDPNNASAIRLLLTRELRAIRREVEAYPDDSAPWVLLPGWPNSGGTLALHVAGNLQHYIGAVLGESGYVRDRDAEFAHRDIPRTELAAELDRAAEAVGEALDRLDPAALGRAYPLVASGDPSVTTGGMLTHLLSHTAYHLGQIDYHRRAVTGEGGGVAAIALRELTSPPSGDDSS